MGWMRTYLSTYDDALSSTALSGCNPVCIWMDWIRYKVRSSVCRLGDNDFSDGILDDPARHRAPSQLAALA